MILRNWYDLRQSDLCISFMGFLISFWDFITAEACGLQLGGVEDDQPLISDGVAERPYHFEKNSLSLSLSLFLSLFWLTKELSSSNFDIEKRIKDENWWLMVGAGLVVAKVMALGRWGEAWDNGGWWLGFTGDDCEPKKLRNVFCLFICDRSW